MVLIFAMLNAPDRTKRQQARKAVPSPDEVMVLRGQGVRGDAKIPFNPHTPDEAIICSVDAAIQLT
ncbi:MAG: hypothetical protein WA624_15910 [Methylocella sp.]